MVRISPTTKQKPKDTGPKRVRARDLVGKRVELQLMMGLPATSITEKPDVECYALLYATDGESGEKVGLWLIKHRE